MIYPASAELSPSIDIYADKTFKTFELRERCKKKIEKKPNKC